MRFVSLRLETKGSHTLTGCVFVYVFSVPRLAICKLIVKFWSCCVAWGTCVHTLALLAHLYNRHNNIYLPFMDVVRII